MKSIHALEFDLGVSDELAAPAAPASAPRWLAALLEALAALDQARARAGVAARGHGADVVEIHYDPSGRPRVAKIRAHARFPLDKPNVPP